MSDDKIIGTDCTFLFSPPQFDKWEYRISGDSLVVRPLKGQVPNWFHRNMQTLCLGIEWRKVDDQ